MLFRAPLSKLKTSPGALVDKVALIVIIAISRSRLPSAWNGLTQIITVATIKGALSAFGQLTALSYEHYPSNTNNSHLVNVVTTIVLRAT